MPPAAHDSVLVFIGTTGPFPQLPHTTQFKKEISTTFRPIANLGSEVPKNNKI